MSFLLGGFVPVVDGATKALAWFWGTAAVPGVAVRGFATVQAAGVRAFVAIGAGWTALRAALTWGSIRGALVAGFSALSAAALSSFAAIGVGWTALRAALTWGSIRGALVAGFSALSAAALSSFAAIGVGWTALKSALTWGSVRAALVAGFGTLAAVGAAAWGAIGSAALAAWTVMTGGTIWIVIGIIAALAAAGALLVAAWKPVSTFFGGLWQGLSEGSGRVGAAFGRLLEALGPVGEGIVWVFRKVGEGFSWLTGLFGSADATEAGRSWGKAIIDGLVGVIDFITGMIEKVKELFGWVGRVSGISRLFGGGEDGDSDQSTDRGGLPGDDDSPAVGVGFPVDSDPTAPRFGGFFGDPGDQGDAGSLLAAPLGPPALAAAAGGGGSQTINRSTSVTVERIEINADGGDPDLIAARVGESLREQLHNTAEDFDTDVVR